MKYTQDNDDDGIAEALPVYEQLLIRAGIIEDPNNGCGTIVHQDMKHIAEFTRSLLCTQAPSDDECGYESREFDQQSTDFERSPFRDPPGEIMRACESYSTLLPGIPKALKRVTIRGDDPPGVVHMDECSSSLLLSKLVPALSPSLVIPKGRPSNISMITHVDESAYEVEQKIKAAEASKVASVVRPKRAARLRDTKLSKGNETMPRLEDTNIKLTKSISGLRQFLRKPKVLRRRTGGSTAHAS